jgi:hypothetical protein
MRAHRGGQRRAQDVSRIELVTARGMVCAMSATAAGVFMRERQLFRTITAYEKYASDWDWSLSVQ